MSWRWLGAAVERVAASAACATALILGVVLCGACGREECEPAECEPCVGERCELTCVPVDEEVACEWECSQGAVCDFECQNLCCLTCDASDCKAVDSVYTEYCSNNSDCTLLSGYATYCDDSRCEHDCPQGDCQQVCQNGSECDLHCGPDGDLDFGVCSASCDATSTCHLACDGGCMLCCGGSADCSMDCPEGGQSCEGDVIVCGTDCPVDRSMIPPGEGLEKYNFCPEWPSERRCF